MQDWLSTAIRILLCLQCKNPVSIMLEMASSLSYNSDLFNLKVRQTRKLTSIGMQLNTPIVNTCDVPHTLKFLEENYPGVLKTQCFNEKNLPFSTEVAATEIGHLFEHILIDELCSLKIRSGATEAIFNGITSWNWKKYPRGYFQILVDIGKEELNLLIEGLKKAIELIKNLLQMGISNSLRATPASPALWNYSI